MPTELDDRITRALGRLADSVDVADPVEVPNIEWSAPPETVRRGPLAGWLAVAAALVLGLVVIGVWRRNVDTGVGEVPAVTTTVVTPPIDRWSGWPVGDGYGDVPPLADVSVFYLPDPMPTGWHVTEMIYSGALDLDQPVSGVPLESDPPLLAGTYRMLSVSMIREDGAASVRYSAIEKPVAREFSISDGGEESEIDGKRVATYRPGPDGYAPPWLDDAGGWYWVQDGRSFEMDVAGDAAAARVVVEAMQQVEADTLLDAVLDGQRFARALPTLEEIVLPDATSVRVQGTDDRVFAVCVDAQVATCSFVGTLYGRGGLALGWAGTASFGFQYAWLPNGEAGSVAGDPASVRTDFGTFLSDIGPEGVSLQLAESLVETIGAARHDLVGMPRLAELTADGASVVPITVPAEPGTTTPEITPEVSGPTVSADGGVIEVPDEASVFYLPAGLPEGWIVGSVFHAVDAELDWTDDGEEIEAVPPFESASARELIVHFIRTDGTAFASLDVWETPHADAFAPFDDAEVVRVAGIDRAVSPRSTGLPAPLGLTGGREWRWVQNGRSFTLSIVGDDSDAETFLTVILPASASEIVDAVQAGQDVARTLPVIEQVTTDDGVTVTTHGEDGRVVAACIDGVAVRRCGFVDELGGHPDVIFRSYLTESGPAAFVWVPASLRDSVFVPDEWIETPTGAVAIGVPGLVFGDASRQEPQPLPYARLGEPVGTTFDEPFAPLG